jgi:hypothetical protein
MMETCLFALLGMLLACILIIAIQGWIIEWFFGDDE